MAVHYFDSSALAKRYIAETDTAWVKSLFASPLDNEAYIVGVTRVEIIAAITRRERGGTLAAEDAAHARDLFRTHVNNVYGIVEVTEGLLIKAMELAETYGLRGYDAIQLAAGCTINAFYVDIGLPPVTFVSADAELNVAAVTEGLRVDNPNLHS